MAKFAEVLKSLAADAKAVAEVSRKLERHNAKDHELVRQRRRVAVAGKKLSEANIAKPRTGRGLTVKAVELAVTGATQPRRVRAKLLRAVNAIAKHKKKNAVTAVELFGEAKVKVGKPPVKKK